MVKSAPQVVEHGGIIPVMQEGTVNRSAAKRILSVSTEKSLPTCMSTFHYYATTFGK